MKKINQGQLVLSFVLLSLIVITLYRQFDNFVFHTYETRIYNKEMYRGTNDDLTIDYYRVIQDDQGYQFGDAKMIIKNDHFIHQGDQVEVTSTLFGKTYQHQISEIDATTYQLSLFQEDHVSTLGEIRVEIKNKTTNQSTSLSLAPVKMGVYSGQNKEFSYKEFYVYKDRILLGSLNCANLEKYQKDYQQVHLEYRYLMEGQDTPVVFYSRQGELSDILNKNFLQSEDVQLLDGVDLNTCKLSVVVILQGDDDLAFSIDLNKESEDRS